MTTQPTPGPDAARLERTYDAPAELIRELLTTPAGLVPTKPQGPSRGLASLWSPPTARHLGGPRPRRAIG
jgi:hypothetical protein